MPLTFSGQAGCPSYFVDVKTPSIIITIFLMSVALSGAAKIDFNRDVRPILADKCYKCHGPDANERKADLRFDVEEGAFVDLGGYHAIVRGDPDTSELVHRITTDEEEDMMPPADSDLSLTAPQKEILRRWIAEGAEWQRHWSFQPPGSPPLPPVSRSEWARNGIDRFILARLDAEGLAPAAEADRVTLIRRASLDLTGLPPTPAEVDAFLADESRDAFERAVDRLLASPRYGETMALTWLDAARYADTDGYQNDGPREMWRWRDWVIEAYNANMPFDRFTIEQLAGDLLPDPTLDQLVATGFNRNHRYNSEAGLVLEEFLLENAVDRVDTTSTIWMGLTMGCARCHDHKYDPISQKEYYQLISFFDNVPESGRAVKFGNSEPWITAPTRVQAKKLAAYDRKIESAAKALEEAEPEIVKAQAAWENEVGQASSLSLKQKTGWKPVLLSEGLAHHFPLDGDDPEIEAEKGEPKFKEGIIGKAASLDGKSQFKLPPAGQFLCQSRRSIAFWLRPEDISKGVILSAQTKNTRRPGLGVEMREGRLQFYMITRWVAGVGAIETVAKLTPGEWRHVTLINDGSQSARGMQIYLDGEPVATRVLHNTNSNTGGNPKDTPLRIGGGVHGTHFAGQVDALRIYERTLWREEITLLAEPATAEAIARKNAGKRTDSERAALRAFFLEHAAPEALKKLAAAAFDARRQRQKYHDSLQTTMVMRESDPLPPTHLRVRGVYHQRGEEVSSEVPEIFPGMNVGLPRNRLGFARWLVSGAHPLTARVAVNRYWQKYFGRGLVKTAEDFGLQGEMPSHPALLDWLATEFVRSGWDIKGIQKLIVTSATYRQDSRARPDLRARDPRNVLLARGPRQRLSAHAVRDQALLVSGLLVERLGGPSVSPYQPAKLWETMSNMKYTQSRGEDLYRRSLYTIWKRTVAPPTMAVMDAADRESCIVNLKRTNTPLQALTLLNETAFVEAARNLGQRILLEGGDSAADRVQFAFRTVAARPPREEERDLLAGAYAEYLADYQRDPAAAGKLIATGESVPDASVDAVELAAATALANVLLNLDEVITKE